MEWCALLLLCFAAGCALSCVRRVFCTLWLATVEGFDCTIGWQSFDVLTTKDLPRASSRLTSLRPKTHRVSRICPSSPPAYVMVRRQNTMKCRLTRALVFRNYGSGQSTIKLLFHVHAINMCVHVHTCWYIHVCMYVHVQCTSNVTADRACAYGPVRVRSVF